jgi:hypothetical protein
LIVPFRPRDTDALATIAERLPAEVDARDVRLTVTGRPLMERELGTTMHAEMVWFLIAVALGNAVLIWLRVRSVAVTLAILAVPGAVILLLLALLGATGRPIDAVNLIVFPLTIGLGVDNCVYLRSAAASSARCGAVASTGRPLSPSPRGRRRSASACSRCRATRRCRARLALRDQYPALLRRDHRADADAVSPRWIAGRIRP